MTMKSYAVCGVLLGLFLNIHGESTAQTSVCPTSASGTTRVIRSADGRTYAFSYNGILLYRYDTKPDGQLKGNFVGLTASRDGKNYFNPSMCGGVLAVDGERIVSPCEGEVSYALASQRYSSDSVALLWRMMRDNTQLYSYWMTFSMSGKTLVIDISSEGDNRNGGGVTLGEAFSDNQDLAVVPVPYLTLTNLVCQKSTGTFASMFFDWEKTSCSRLMPLAQQQGHTLFATSAEYFPRNDGTRNRLKEQIYLTVSDDINEVMPNVVGPVAPQKRVLQKRIVLSYHFPFPALLQPIIQDGRFPSYLDTLKGLGIKDVALLVKDWWWSGFDRGNPNVLPANDFAMDRDGWATTDWEKRGGGGDKVLLRVRDAARKNGFLFGLHQNYVDLYGESRRGGKGRYRVDSTLVAELPKGKQKRAWAFARNPRGQNAWAVRPARVVKLATDVSADIYKAYHLDWNYLDVSSSLNPSGPLPIEGHGFINSVVDFDAGKTNPARDSAGMFLYTLHQYRKVPQAVRKSTKNAPVEGEGGNHFLYAGYFDDFEARIRTGVPEMSGYATPLFVDFQLNKLASRSSYHGVGHIQEFFGRGWGALFSDSDILTYIATELAYGNSGLVTKAAHNCKGDSPCDHSLRQFAIEKNHVLPLQKLLVDAKAIRTTYFDSHGKEMTASQYIAAYAGSFADILSPNFMGRVRVEYNNGVVVYVNRNREAGNWTLNGLPAGKSYHYNILRGGEPLRDVGTKPADPLILPAESGWVWYAP